MENLSKYLTLALISEDYRAERSSASYVAGFFEAARRDGQTDIKRSECLGYLFTEEGEKLSVVKTQFDFYRHGVRLATVKAYKAAK